MVSCLPIVKGERDVIDLLVDGVSRFVVVPELWAKSMQEYNKSLKERGVPEVWTWVEVLPKVEVKSIEPTDDIINEAYEVKADMICDLLDYITNMVMTKPAGVYFIEIKAVVVGYTDEEVDDDRMLGVMVSE